MALVQRKTVIALGIIGILSLNVSGHGYMWEPASRSTAWRYGFGTPRNVNDNGLNCGGRSAMHETNGGRCGVCGDNYASVAKPNEPGPGNVYATGTIVKQYDQGQQVDINVLITAFHQGYFEFRLCVNDVPQKGKDAGIAVTQHCLDKRLLTAPDGVTTRFSVAIGKNTHTIQLPSDVHCEACVLQWKYRTGNHWGCEIVDGSKRCGLGYGPQEVFKGCADVKITAADTPEAKTSDRFTTSEMTPTTAAATTTNSKATSQYKTTSRVEGTCYGIMRPDFDQWCQTTCDLGGCDPAVCWCEGMPVPMVKSCVGKQLYGGEKLNNWCNIQCNSPSAPTSCYPTHCECVLQLFNPL